MKVSQSGVKILRSGNKLNYFEVVASGRGGVTGNFDREPTDEDIEEAKAFIVTLAPKDAQMKTAVVDSKREAVQRLSDHLTKNARSN